MSSLLLGVSASALADPGDLGLCGNLRNGYGPYDYRTDRKQLVVVEQYHFTALIEALIRGNTDSIGGDLDYTLRAYPNHHRALNALMRYGEKLKTEWLPGANFTVECYFIRAVSHRPDDATVRMLYATYLDKKQKRPEALQQLDIAKTLAADVGFTHYNIGLLCLEIGEYERALAQAHTAMSLGFTRTELKDRLVAANRWAEPNAAPAPHPAASQ